MIRVCWSWIVASANPGLPTMTMSAGREMCMTLAWSMVTESASAADAPGATAIASRTRAGPSADGLDGAGIGEPPNTREDLTNNGERRLKQSLLARSGRVFEPFWATLIEVK